ncbi:GntR family transcriptional regulator [Thermobispora bispora]|uniref:GntR family transcriptional regulator n=1 Tax=Thermobispora bispora TaxID=2006 RepID=UPI001F55B24C|nr:winged helix-turn-helix domain-containing protein [Thermobispora bispora]
MARLPAGRRPLRERITTGAYPAGSILPSEAALSAEFRVARNTIRRALEALEADGLILTVPSQRSPGPGGRPDRHRLLQVPGDRQRAGAEDQTGRSRAGDPLPSEAELAWLYDVSRHTVRHAFAELERAGLIVSHHGKGRFVCPPPRRPGTSDPPA